MEDELESAGPEEVPAAVPGKSKLPILAGAIGLLMFVLSVAIFSITMGVFSSSNVAPTSQHADDAAGVRGEDDGKGATGPFHSSYYDDSYPEEEPPATEGSEKMTEKDSVAQMAWYEKQKQEIENEWRKIEVEYRDLEKLKYETMDLLDQRKNIEDANTIELAKLFDSMKAPEIAAILNNMTDQQVGMILMKMKKQNASKVLAALPAERAARITSQMMNLAESN